MPLTPIAATSEPRNAMVFKEWLASQGGGFHPGVRYSSSVSSGLSIIASEDIEPEATIVTCPFSIIITPSLSKDALLPILKDASILERWTERQSIIVYICFHWIINPKIYDTLVHAPYLDTFPSPEQLRTPLHFTSAELDALRGTNVHGATIDRSRVWEEEWEQCRVDVSAVDAEWGRALTWERFLTAATYLSSRAFPSTLLSRSPTLIQRPESYPVLIPGVDALNHARAQPVSWVVTCPPTQTPSSSSSSASSSGATSSHGNISISLVAHTASKAGAEIFNNYGAKPNSELLLGYGFTLPANPDDTIVLKIGGGLGSSSSNMAAQHEVGRGSRGADSVWGAIEDAVKTSQDESDDVPEWQIVLDCADMLRTMTESLLARLPRPGGLSVPILVPGEESGLRGDVVEMIDRYVSGQREVLQDLLQYANDREMDGVLLARHEGVVIQLEGENDDDRAHAD